MGSEMCIRDRYCIGCTYFSTLSLTALYSVVLGSASFDDGDLFSLLDSVDLVTPSSDSAAFAGGK